MTLPPGRQGPGPIPDAVLKTLDLRVARRASGFLPGERRAPGTGAGTELAQLRPYQPGDDVRQLDAAATARTSVPHVRLQVPERTPTTWLLLDGSPSMAFGTADRLKSDVAEGVATVVGRLATRRGGQLAITSFGGPHALRVPARGGRGALNGLRRVLSAGVAPDGTTEPGGLSGALRRIGKVARNPGLVVIVSDFRGERDWRRPLAQLSARHSTLAIEILDPRELELPKVGPLALIDPETGARVEVDTSRRGIRERFAAAEAQRRAEVAADLRAARCDHIALWTQGDWLRELGRRLR